MQFSVPTRCGVGMSCVPRARDDSFLTRGFRISHCWRPTRLRRQRGCGRAVGWPVSRCHHGQRFFDRGLFSHGQQNELVATTPTWYRVEGRAHGQKITDGGYELNGAISNCSVGRAPSRWRGWSAHSTIQYSVPLRNGVAKKQYRRLALGQRFQICGPGCETRDDGGSGE